MKRSIVIVFIFILLSILACTTPEPVGSPTPTQEHWTGTPNITLQPTFTPYIPTNTPDIPEAPCVMLTTEALNVREAPNGAVVLDVVPAESYLAVDGVYNEWYHFDAGYTNGWVSGTYLEVHQGCTSIPELDPGVKMSIHMTVGTSQDAVLNYIQRVGGVSSLKGLDTTENILNTVEQLYPETLTIFRTKTFGDCPTYSAANPREVGVGWVDQLAPLYANVNADVYEIVNECAFPPDWFVEFTLGALTRADQIGIKLVVLSDGPGNPTLEVFEEYYIPVYQYVTDHPGHYIARHVYGIDGPLSTSGIWLGERFKLEMEILEPYRLENTPLLLTEAMYGDGRMRVSCTELAWDMSSYEDIIAPYDNIYGAQMFTTTIPASEWFDITYCLDEFSKEM